MLYIKIDDDYRKELAWIYVLIAGIIEAYGDDIPFDSDDRATWQAGHQSDGNVLTCNGILMQRLPTSMGLQTPITIFSQRSGKIVQIRRQYE